MNADGVSHYCNEFTKRKEHPPVHTAKVLSAASCIDNDFGRQQTGHTGRVQKVSLLVAESLGLDSEFCENIYFASAYHDVGLTNFPKTLLHRWYEPNPTLKNAIREHAISGFNSLVTCPSEIMQMAALIALEHHERWDGTGYPRGKSGNSISLAARIVAIAHFYDELISPSPELGREKFEMEQAKEMISMTAGLYFEPKLVAIFRKAIKERKPLDYQAQLPVEVI